MKFRLVDRILSYQPSHSITAIKTISFEEYQLKAAWGGPACLPETLLLESLFQLGNWLIMLDSNFTQMGLLIRWQEIHFKEQPGPGQTLYLNVHVKRDRPDGVLFDGHIQVDGHLIAQGQSCLASRVPLESYYDPEDMKVLFSEIYSPI